MPGTDLAYAAIAARACRGDATAKSRIFRRSLPCGSSQPDIPPNARGVAAGRHVDRPRASYNPTERHGVARDGDPAHSSRTRTRDGTPACSEPRPASFIHSTQAYYSNDEQVLDSLVYATPGFAVNLDAKLAALAVQKGGAKKKFVVAALGSSVTAGHDGFGDTAWPAVLQRRLAKALAPFGIEVEVRNQAVGGSEPFPRSLCMSTLAGDDADLVIREWERARGAGQTGRGGDAETTRTVRGDGSRRRRGRHVDSPRRRVAAPPRLPRG